MSICVCTHRCMYIWCRRPKLSSHLILARTTIQIRFFLPSSCFRCGNTMATFLETERKKKKRRHVEQGTLHTMEIDWENKWRINWSVFPVNDDRCASGYTRSMQRYKICVCFFLIYTEHYFPHIHALVINARQKKSRWGNVCANKKKHGTTGQQKIMNSKYAHWTTQRSVRVSGENHFFFILILFFCRWCSFWVRFASYKEIIDDQSSFVCSSLFESSVIFGCVCVCVYMFFYCFVLSHFDQVIPGKFQLMLTCEPNSLVFQNLIIFFLR